MRGLSFILLGLLAISTVASAQSEEKAQIIVTSFRKDTVTVKYDYVFKSFAWNLMTYALSPEGEITYKRPANLPGCKQLGQMGIDQGKFTIAANNVEVCSGPLSICDTTNYEIEVHERGCRSRKVN